MDPFRELLKATCLLVVIAVALWGMGVVGFLAVVRVLEWLIAG